jgi:excisionase family DNA binding protein
MDQQTETVVQALRAAALILQDAADSLSGGAPGYATRPQQASYSVSDAARLLEVPQRTLHGWIAEGKIPSEVPVLGQRGRRIRAEVVETLRRNRAGANGAAEPPGAASPRQE